MPSKKEDKIIPIESHKKFNVNNEKASFNNKKNGKNEEDESFSTASSINEKKSPYMTASAAVALCLMLVGVPFLNRYSFNNRYSFKDLNNNRAPACSETEDPNCKIRNIKAQNQIKKLKEQEKKFIKEIKSGKRGIASVGKKPKAQDVFSIELLKNKYKTKWKNDKLLLRATLWEGEEPISLPPISEVVSEYSFIFPSYSNISKLDTLSVDKEEWCKLMEADSSLCRKVAKSGDKEIYKLDKEIYKLMDGEGLMVAKVEALKNPEGKVLSIHVHVTTSKKSG